MTGAYILDAVLVVYVLPVGFTMLYAWLFSSRTGVRFELCRDVQKFPARGAVRLTVRHFTYPDRSFFSADSGYQPLPGRSVGVVRSVHDPIELSGGSLTFIEAFDRKQACLRHDARDSHSDLPAVFLHCMGSLCDKSRLGISLDCFKSVPPNSHNQ